MKVQFDDIVEAWENDKSGEYICVLPDENRAYYVAHGRRIEEIKPKLGNIWVGIRAWQDSNGYFPNIWSANDHGNLTLWSRNGKDLGGIV